jgi:hypothetical protein
MVVKVVVAKERALPRVYHTTCAALGWAQNSTSAWSAVKWEIGPIQMPSSVLGFDVPIIADKH